MFKLFKKIIKSSFNIIGLDIIKLKSSSDSYFYKPKEIFFHPALKKVRQTIYNDCPSPMYRESYHLHQIGSWGSLPSIICLYNELKNKKGVKLESLDIGCAFGTMAAFCNELGFKASATDFVPKETYLGEKTQKTYNIDFHQVSIETEDLPWSEKKFDIITMTEVLEHFHYQPLDTLQKIRKVLKDDGIFLITTPALGPHWHAKHYDCPFEQIPSYNNEIFDDTDKHYKIYDAQELERLLKKAGFKAFITLSLSINTGREVLSAVALKK